MKTGDAPRVKTGGLSGWSVCNLLHNRCILLGNVMAACRSQRLLLTVDTPSVCLWVEFI